MQKVINFNAYVSGQKTPRAEDAYAVEPEVVVEPSTEETEWELAEDRTSEPIKDLADVQRVSSYLVDSQRWRDNMLFICGINFGLRISDLLRLRFKNLINQNGTFKKSFPILEKKTRNTRKVRANRVITINDAVKHAVTLYLDNMPGTSLDDFMFKCEGNRGGHKNVPITARSVNRILKGIADDLGLENKMSTHSMRKTFAYHQMQMSNNDPRKLLLIQKMFGHSTMMQTLTYIGITQEEMAEAYRGLNLGMASSVHGVSYPERIAKDSLIDSQLMEERLADAK